MASTIPTPDPHQDPHNEIVPVLDCGGQTMQLIARRLREAGIYSMIQQIISLKTRKDVSSFTKFH